MAVRTLDFKKSEEKFRKLLLYVMRQYAPDAKKVISEHCNVDEQIIEMWLSGERLPHIGTFLEVVALLEPHESCFAATSKWYTTSKFLSEVTFVHMALTKSVSEVLP